MRKIFLAALLVLMTGCASLPPTIDQGEYQNYRYGFIVRLPADGWVMTKTVPESFSAYLVPEAPERVLLLLHNPQTRGLIAVRGGTMFFPTRLRSTSRRGSRSISSPFSTRTGA